MSWIDRSSSRGSGLSDFRAIAVRARFLCEMHALGGTYAPAHSILTYITCSQHYPIDKIVVGSCPYPQHIVPPLGSAYSQTRDSENTPTTRIFSLHFEDGETAAEALRRSWTLLLQGYLFINADFMPSSMGGGDQHIDSIQRIEMSVEWLICMLLRRKMGNVQMMAMGKLALSYCDIARKRLKALGFRVRVLTSKQPVAFSGLSANAHMVGRSDKYSCCTGSSRQFFERMLTSYKSCAASKECDIVLPVLKEVSDMRVSMPATTKTALTTIHNDARSLRVSISSRLSAHGSWHKQYTCSRSG